MPRLTMHCTAFVIALTLSTALSAQGVRLTRVPDLVRLPAAAGSNLVVEVEVDGAAAAVWLATDMASRDRVPLTSAGERRWQLNLADAKVADLLPAGRDGGTFTVFATVGTSTLTSAPIAWSKATPAGRAVACIGRRTDGTTHTWLPHPFDGFAISGVAGAHAWIDLAAFARFEVQGLGDRQSAVVAHGDDLEQPLVRDAASGTWTLTVDKALRERLRDAADFEIEARVGAGSRVHRFRLVPTTLALDGARADIVVRQRRHAEIPGSRGWLTVAIDDITMGRTMLRVFDAEGRDVVAQECVHARDFVSFALTGERYVLVVDDLVNLLIGDDHAALHVERAAGFVPDRIGQLIRAVGKSTDTFVREDKEYAAAATQQFLIARLGSHKGAPVTVEQFVDSFASTSSQTGKPYLVKKADGTTVTMRDWLRAELARLEASAAK